MKQSSPSTEVGEVWNLETLLTQVVCSHTQLLNHWGVSWHIMTLYSFQLKYCTSEASASLNFNKLVVCILASHTLYIHQHVQHFIYWYTLQIIQHTLYIHVEDNHSKQGWNKQRSTSSREICEIKRNASHRPIKGRAHARRDTNNFQNSCWH